MGAYSGDDLLAEGAYFSKAEAEAEACRIALTTHYAQVWRVAGGGGFCLRSDAPRAAVAAAAHGSGCSPRCPCLFQKLADAPLPSEAADYSPEEEVREERLLGRGSVQYVYSAAHRHSYHIQVATAEAKAKA